MKNSLGFVKPLVSIILSLVLILAIMAPVSYASVNTSIKFKLTYDGQEKSYYPGTQIRLYASAVNDGNCFDGFEYDENVIRNPGFYYNNNRGFIMTFQMPSCDTEITTTYGDNWQVMEDGNTIEVPSATSRVISGYAYVEHYMLSEDQSGYNPKLMPGDAVVTKYPSSPVVRVTINGSLKTYAAGQPIVINEQYADGNTGDIISGYMVNGEFMEGDSHLYTSLATGAVYKNTVLPGVETDTVIETVKEEGCLVVVQDNIGNTFVSELVKKGTNATFALPTNKGEYTLHDIKGTDASGSDVSIGRTDQTDGSSLLTLTTTTARVNIEFSWREKAEEQPVVESKTPERKVSRSKLPAVINSTGVVEVYSPSDILNPKARIDADDIQKNRDAIIEIQNMLSSNGRLDTTSEEKNLDREAVYFFQDPIITNKDGTTEQLKGYFMQKGSDIPRDNDTWLQIG